MPTISPEARINQIIFVTNAYLASVALGNLKVSFGVLYNIYQANLGVCNTQMEPTPKAAC